MADKWWEKAIRDAAPSSYWGTYTGGPAKGVWHTTEGKSYAGARSAYWTNRSWPHVTASYERGRFQAWQHIPFNRSARALKNLAGGVQTNTDTAIQVEIVGTSNTANRSTWGDQYVEYFPQAFLAGLADLAAHLYFEMGVRLETRVRFKPYPDSYGSLNGIRMSPTTWNNYSGWCGHQHVPENTHGDPGLLDHAYLLNRAGYVAGLVAQNPDLPVEPPLPVIPWAPDVRGFLGGIAMARQEVFVPTDSAGNGWVLLDMPFSKLLSAQACGEVRPPIQQTYDTPDNDGDLIDEDPVARPVEHDGKPMIYVKGAVATSSTRVIVSALD